jgi:hypothetical protein
MTSPVATNPSWDFTDVYDLLESLRCLEPGRPPENEVLDRRDSAPTPPQRLPSPSQFDPQVNMPQSLGDFNRLYELLGLPTQGYPLQIRNKSIESSGSSFSDLYDPTHVSPESTPPSPPPDVIKFDEIVNRKVRWTDQVDGLDAVDVRQRSSSRKRHTRLKSSSKSSNIKNSADFDSETDIETFRRVPALIPSWVTLQTAPQKLWLPPIPSAYADPTIIQPLETLTIEEKRTKLIKKLKLMIDFGPTVDQERELHIFVDCSNIVIGFYDALKFRRGYDIKAHTKQAPLSWKSLATILERQRPVARRVLVGSNGSPHHSQPAKLPDFMLEAEKLGYELNILDRVFKYKDQTPTKKRRPKGGNGYATTSGLSSGMFSSDISTDPNNAND